MPAPDNITAAQLPRLLGTPDTPRVLDVRTEEDFASDPRTLPGSLRRDFRTAADWGAVVGPGPLAVVCQSGPQLGQGVAAWLRHLGTPAGTLEGGFEAWTGAGNLLARPDHLPRRDGQGRTVWVTRGRPKIDRIVCPWLIRRFVDPAAAFLFVAPSGAASAADRFGTTPFAVEGVFWSHGGELRTLRHGRGVMMRRTALWAAVLGGLALGSARAQTPGADPEWRNTIAEILGKPGTDMPGGIDRVALPRTSLQVTLDGVPIRPAFALGSWAALLEHGGQMVAMGDLVLPEREVVPVMRRLAAEGLEATAPHNPLPRAQPATMYLHVAGASDVRTATTALGAALDRTNSSPAGG